MNEPLMIEIAPGVKVMHGGTTHREIAKLQRLISRAYCELITVEYDNDPPMRVVELLKEMQEAMK